jgi:peptide/nickel transport system permease protein
MIALIVRRILLIFPNLAIVTFILYVSVFALLGTPAAMMLGEDASKERIEELNREYGFDRPVVAQYLGWMGHALRGDLGRSFTTQQRVAEAVLPRLAPSLEIGCLAIVLAALGATLLNTLRVAQRGLAPVLVGLSVIGITVPNFLLGISLIYLLSVKLGWLPSTGWAPWSDGVVTHVVHLIMPVTTLAAFYFGSYSLVYRAEYRSVWQRPYIGVARAKGLPEWKVAFNHAMPNAMLPVVTLVGVSMGRLIGGAVVTETVFSVPGVGRLLVTSILSHDFPIMLALGMLIIAGVMLVNLATDIVYVVVNPQIRLEGSR